MKSKSKPEPEPKTAPKPGAGRANGEKTLFIRIDGSDLLRRIAQEKERMHLEQAGEKLAYEQLANASQCADSGVTSQSTLIPSLVKSLLQELDATRKTVAILRDRLATVLSAPKKDGTGALGYATGDGAPSLANELSALGNGFYNERQALEDLIARLQL